MSCDDIVRFVLMVSFVAGSVLSIIALVCFPADFSFRLADRSRCDRVSPVHTRISPGNVQRFHFGDFLVIFCFDRCLPTVSVSDGFNEDPGVLPVH